MLGASHSRVEGCVREKGKYPGFCRVFLGLTRSRLVHSNPAAALALSAGPCKETTCSELERRFLLLGERKNDRVEKLWARSFEEQSTRLPSVCQRPVRVRMSRTRLLIPGRGSNRPLLVAYQARARCTTVQNCFYPSLQANAHARALHVFTQDSPPKCDERLRMIQSQLGCRF